MTIPADTSTADTAPEELFDPKRILRQMVVAIVVIALLFIGALLLFKDELSAVSHVFVDSLGGFGIALGFVLPDAFTIPLPNDAFTFFGYAGGMPFWECVAWGTGGSLVGGTIGFNIGRLLQRTQRFQRIMATRGKEVRQMVERFAIPTLLIAALTPIPYSLACWAVGAGGMRFRVFILVSLTRFVRVTFYLWLIAEGILPAFDASPVGP